MPGMRFPLLIPWLISAAACFSGVHTMQVIAQPLPETRECSQFISPEMRQSEARMARRGIVCVRGELIMPHSVNDPDNSADELRRLRQLSAPAAGKKSCEVKRTHELEKAPTASPPA